MASLLLHACCAHCAAYTVGHWRNHGFQVTVFWYNPNIHPYLEHERRLEAVSIFAQTENLPLIVYENYDLTKFFQVVVGYEQDRCRRCFQLRLLLTAKTARTHHFAAFTTTLLISPHQKHEHLKEVGEAIAKEAGIAFLYHDLRPRYKESHQLTKQLNLYRQQYCGCVYSEWERYAKVKTG